MKKFRILIIFSLLAITGIVFYSCQKEKNNLPVDQEQQVMTLKSEYAETDCSVACLQAGPYEQASTSFVNQWVGVPGFSGYFKNNKYFIATAWHDADFFYIRTDVFGYQYNREKINGVWTLTGPTFNNYPFSSVMITLNGITSNFSMDNPATPEIIETAETYTQAFSLPGGWAQCDEMVYTVKILGGGQQVWLGTASAPANITYEMIGYCTTVTLDASPSTVVSPGGQVILTGTVSSDGAFTGGIVKIQELDGANSTDVAMASVTPDNRTVSFVYIPENPGTTTFIARYDGTGSNGYNPGESAPVSIFAQADCINGLHGQAISCGADREANYLFTYEGSIDYVKIQGSLIGLSNLNTSELAVVNLNGIPVVFDVVEYFLNDDIIYTGQNVEGYTVKQLILANSPDRIISVEGAAACEQPVDINITWNSVAIEGAITGPWTAEDNTGNIIFTNGPLYCE